MRDGLLLREWVLIREVVLIKRGCLKGVLIREEVLI